MEFKINEQDLAGLRRAINRNPQMVVNETGKFLRRGIARHKSTIENNPWRIGGSGGGAPVDTGELRQSHIPPIYKKWEARIEPNRTGKAPYYIYVHEGTKKMEARPWLQYAIDQNRSEIDILQRELLDNVTKDIAK